MSKLILHVDMDAFFAAIEQNDDPSLCGKPVVIGSDPKKGKGRGVVSTCSYEARVFGIRSAMPISEAYKRCPDAIYLPPRMGRYIEVSKNIMEIFNNYSPVVEKISVDEAFIDCSNMERLLGSAYEIGSFIKRDVKQKSGLTCSVGASAVKSISKIASDLNKPDGLTVCEPGNEKNFLAPLSINKLWGVGKKTQAILASYNINTIGDIANTPLESLKVMFGKNGVQLYLLANGIDDRDVEPDYEGQKSISKEITFNEDIINYERLLHTIKHMCDELTHELRRSKRKAKTVNLKIRYSSFETITRSKTLDNSTNSFHTLLNNAHSLVENSLTKTRKVRLIGIGFSNLSENEDGVEIQGDLFENILAENSNKTDTIYTQLKDKYGYKVRRASLLNNNTAKD
jgi:DNA polymerase-4